LLVAEVKTKTKKKGVWKPHPDYVLPPLKDWRGRIVKEEVVFRGEFVDKQKVELHYPEGEDRYGNTRWVCKYNGVWFKSVIYPTI